MPKKESIIRTTIRLPESLWRKIRRTALDRKTTAQQLVIDLIQGMK